MSWPKVQGSVGLTPMILQSQWWRRSPVARNSWFLRRWSWRFWMSSVLLPTRPTSDGPASAVMCWSQVGRGLHQLWLVYGFAIFWPKKPTRIVYITMCNHVFHRYRLLIFKKWRYFHKELNHPSHGSKPTNQLSSNSWVQWLQGELAFNLDPETGTISGTPQLGLPATQGGFGWQTRRWWLGVENGLRPIGRTNGSLIN